ncbi:RsiW-degrading membrane proteinase PrsW (M82 family) [Streptosporangium becharense]|uniref:RsiW-degrading membrane proteinase PrsW (M82 family) n=1 Tax=Streptosporangium becharense TaxID=1816182 RepID=A0A7W9IMB9_9ACTN|nr:PrsW family intramembrane metalloprotease [Streptosporangium becharense]MBB2911513.1 RsiW-degrading membrane proteinase PrsW (M82 family) [Streptosporangium becharense]MBB5822669.1 RsiW-degrading membrane proteinase PrsW (M82 family) [Streptosporangium becharense]
MRDTWETAGPPAVRDGGRTAARPQRGMVITLAVSGLCALATLAFVLAGSGGDGFGLSVALGVAPLPVLLAAVLVLDRLEPEPRLHLLFAFVWGAGIAVVVSIGLETAGEATVSALGMGPQDARTVTMVAVAPAVEEAAKGAALLWLLWRCRHELDGPTDGIVYASVVALGFAAVENVLYYSAAFGVAGTAATVATFVLRGVLTPLLHPIATSMIGLGVAHAVTGRGGGRFALIPLGYAGAVVLHGMWNGAAALNSPAALGVVYLVGAVVIAGLVTVAVRERRQLVTGISRDLPAYVPTGLVTPEDIGMLSSPRVRRQARRWAGRLGAGRAMSDYQRAATALAALHHRAGRDARVSRRFADDRDALLAVMAASRAHLVIRSAVPPRTRGCSATPALALPLVGPGE